MTEESSQVPVLQIQNDIFKDIRMERDRQDEMWIEDPDHICSMWLTILNKRMGRLAETMLETDASSVFLKPSSLGLLWKTEWFVGTGRTKLYERSIKLAAVAVAFAEQLKIADLATDSSVESDKHVEQTNS